MRHHCSDKQDPRISENPVSLATSASRLIYVCSIACMCIGDQLSRLFFLCAWPFGPCYTVYVSKPWRISKCSDTVTRLTAKYCNNLMTTRSASIRIWRNLRFAVFDIDDQVRVRNCSLKRSDNIIDLRLSCSHWNGQNKIH